MAGSTKKAKRREKKKQKEGRNANNDGVSASSSGKNSKKDENEGPWYSCSSVPADSEELKNAVKVSGGEMVNLMGDGPMGHIVDGIMRNLVRTTSQAFTGKLADVPQLVGKNFLWLQLILVDEERVIQGKFYELGAVVSSAKDGTSLAGRRSTDLFREAAPFLLEGGAPGVVPPHWVFSRSMLLTNYTGTLDDNVFQFAEYDPVETLRELPTANDDGQRCTEAFLMFAGDFTVRDNGSSREAVFEFVRDLTTAEGILKLDGFTICCGTVKVAEEKLESLKNAHMAV